MKFPSLRSLPGLGMLAATLLVAPMASASLTAQGRPLALRGARILPIDGKPIDAGTILMRDGKIEAVGADVKIPAGAQVIDLEGMTVMPGLVSAWSQAGLTQPRPRPQQAQGRRRGRGRFRAPTNSGAPAQNQAATKIADRLYARQEVFAELLAEGVTTLSITPTKPGFPGFAALVDPSTQDSAAFAEEAEAYLAVVPANNSRDKKVLKDTLDKAQKVLDERKKPKPKPEEKKEEPAAKEGDKKAEGEQPADKAKGEAKPPKEGEKPKPADQDKKAEAKAEKPQKKEEPQKDPNLEVLADLLDGKRKAFTRIDSARDLSHFLGAVEKHRFPTVLVSSPRGGGRFGSTTGRLDEMMEQLEELKASVLLAPTLDTKPYTNVLVNPALELHRAGIEIAFLLGDSPRDVRTLMFKVIDLVRHGLPAEVALAAVTHTPAKMLGIADRVGSIAEGREANLLVFSGDPLDPSSSLRHVFYRGEEVSK